MDYFYSYGDVNVNGKVDLVDAVLALQVCAGMTPTEEVNIHADVTGDDKISLEEVIYILQAVAGMR